MFSFFLAVSNATMAFSCKVLQDLFARMTAMVIRMASGAVQLLLVLELDAGLPTLIQEMVKYYVHRLITKEVFAGIVFFKLFYSEFNIDFTCF